MSLLALPPSPTPRIAFSSSDSSRPNGLFEQILRRGFRRRARCSAESSFGGGWGDFSKDSAAELENHRVEKAEEEEKCCCGGGRGG